MSFESLKFIMECTVDVDPYNGDELSDAWIELQEKIPFKSINYAGREYIVIPHPNEVACLCISENMIMALMPEIKSSILDGSDVSLIMKSELKDPFSQKVMNRNDIYNELEIEDAQFYYDVIKEAQRLNKFFDKNSFYKKMRIELMEIIIDGILGESMDVNILNARMKMLTGKSYVYDFRKIVCDEKETNLYQLCKDVYEYEEENEMGIFDNFRSENITTRVFNYVKNMSKYELMSTIKTEYKSIKGSCKTAPTMEKSASIEFAGALLVFVYCKENIEVNYERYSKFLLLLGETIGAAFFGMTPREWNTRIKQTVKNGEVLDNDEWSQICDYLKMNFANEIFDLEFNNGNTSAFKRDELYTNLARVSNRSMQYSQIFDYYKQQGLKI